MAPFALAHPIATGILAVFAAVFLVDVVCDYAISDRILGALRR